MGCTMVPIVTSVVRSTLYHCRGPSSSCLTLLEPRSFPAHAVDPIIVTHEERFKHERVLLFCISVLDRDQMCLGAEFFTRST